MTSIKLIACANELGYIGVNNDLMYKFKEDMDYFRTVTTGHTVLMGRKTWESIPEKFRPLKDRVNIVLSKTRQETDYSNLFYFQDVETILGMVKTGAIQGDLWVMGGGQVYDLFIPHADEIYLTVVNDKAEGDTRFITPDENREDFVLNTMSQAHTDPKTGLTFTFQTYKRKYHGN